MIRQTIMYVAIIAFLFFILLVTGSAIFFTLTGATVARPTISFITETPGLEKTTSLSHIFTESPEVHTQSTPTPKKTSTVPASVSSTPVCGSASPGNILYINSGKNGETKSSEAIRLIHINPSEKSVQVVSFPCDLWVTTPSLVKDYTISAIRLCSILHLPKNPSGSQPDNSSVFNTINLALNDTIQINTDRYILSTTGSLQKIADVLGGFDYLSTDNMVVSGLSLNKGTNQLNSSSIPQLFSLETNETSPWAQLNRQNIVFEALYAKYFQSTFKIVDLITANNVETNLTPADLSSLECTIKNTAAVQIKYIDVFQNNSSRVENGTIQISDLPKVINSLKDIK